MIRMLLLLLFLASCSTFQKKTNFEILDAVISANENNIDSKAFIETFNLELSETIKKDLVAYADHQRNRIYFNSKNLSPNNITIFPTRNTPLSNIKKVIQKLGDNFELKLDHVEIDHEAPDRCMLIYEDLNILVAISRHNAQVEFITKRKNLYSAFSRNNYPEIKWPNPCHWIYRYKEKDFDIFKDYIDR